MEERKHKIFITLSARVFFSILMTEFIIMIFLFRLPFIRRMPQISIAVLDTLLLSLVAIMVIHYAFRPFTEMIKTMERIKNGEAGVRLNMSCGGEMAFIAEEINRMLDGIAESYRKVEDSQRLLAGIADGIDEEIMLVSKDFKVVWANKKAREACALPYSQIVGNYCYKLTHSLNEPCKFPLHHCPLVEIEQKGKAGSSLHTHFDMKGHSFYVEVTAYPLYDENAEIKQYIHISRDVTDRMTMIKEIETANKKLQEYSFRLEHMVDERTMKLRRNMEELAKINEELKKTQSQLIQAGKMAAVGQLASGVAHEINNPLAIILNNIQLVKIMLRDKNIDDSSKDLQGFLQMMEDSVLRCKKITQALHDFSFVSPDKFELFSVNDAIEKTLVLVEYETALQNISFKKNLQPGMPKVFGDFQALQQVFLDMIVNARWAIQKKAGKKESVIVMKSEYKEGDSFIRIFIQDSGIGIEEKIIPRIFEAFFTTKEVGEGTGLGLSIAYNIVKQHHGTIEVKSARGEGSTFIVALPIFK